ncbi:MAG TPA: BTAD domain-containing putative transcriptional regulator [Jatrophihabitans sp.]|nr:BTAD domain-containing putative transcriptional regulator [Jatrophihabitans sp.]
MPTGKQQAHTRTRAASWNLSLFGSWELRHRRSQLNLHRREQRLIALLALQGSRPRGYVAGVLWPESTERHATGNLRAAVWQTQQAAPGLLVHDRASLRLSTSARLDVDAFTRRALRVISWRQGSTPVDRTACLGVLPELLHDDLLPGWYDDWVIYERARLTQLRLRALQLLSDLLVDLGEMAEALIAASTAVSIEPLHEPAIRSLIRAEIEHGDYTGALREYEAYRERVMAELGVPPSSRLDAIMQPLLRHRASVPICFSVA